MRRLLARHSARWVIGILLTLLTAAVSIDKLHFDVVDRIDLFVYDMRLRVLPPVMDERIVIVNIDEKSLAQVGRFPWSRNITADLVDRLFDHYKIKTLGFDVMFSEPDTSSGYATLDALARREFKDLPVVGERLHALKPMLDYDGRLAKAFKDRPVVLGFHLSDELKKGLLPAPAFTDKELDGRTLHAMRFKGYDANLAELQRAARTGGFFNADIDPDGLLRSSPLLMHVDNAYYESLGLATARVVLGATAVYPVFPRKMSRDEIERYGILREIRLNTEPKHTKIPVEDNLTVLIHFRGTGGPAGGAFRYLSAVDVLKGRVPVQELAGKIVLVGTTAPGINDLRATPVKSDYPGVEVHANIIESILDGDLKRRPDDSRGFDLAQILLIGVVLVVALALLSPSLSILFALAVAAGSVAFNFWMYQSFNSVLPIATALLLIVTLFVWNIAWGYLFEFRKGRAMVNLFGEYVAPELVAEMAEDPEAYNMEGDSRVLTVMFADVRGFTTISEGLEPNELREYVNLYLTAMSENIRGNRGTLDKYIGDCVMAFWGAPVALPDHASRAVATALLMQQTAHALSDGFVARGWPPLNIGIGLNTGEMRVGDMGSEIRRAYTVMGDAVNLSSRLEAITKVYGVGIVVGVTTRLAAPDFAYRELDCVRVKGKNEPVPIFQPLALDSKLTEEQRAKLGQWHQALGMVRSQEWDQAEQIIRKLQGQDPDEGLFKEYLKRIAHYREHSPGAGWDGVTTYETKDGA